MSLADGPVQEGGYLASGDGVAGAVVAVSAADRVVRLAEHIDAPVVTTLNGKGALPSRHLLSAGLAVYGAAAGFLEGRDAVLAVGTELSPADFWAGPPRFEGPLIQIDIDAGQFGVNHSVDAPVEGGAGAALEMLEAALPSASRAGVLWAASVLAAAREERRLWAGPIFRGSRPCGGPCPTIPAWRWTLCLLCRSWRCRPSAASL